MLSGGAVIRIGFVMTLLGVILQFIGVATVNWQVSEHGNSTLGVFTRCDQDVCRDFIANNPSMDAHLTCSKVLVVIGLISGVLSIMLTIVYEVSVDFPITHLVDIVHKSLQGTALAAFLGYVISAFFSLVGLIVWVVGVFPGNSRFQLGYSVVFLLTSCLLVFLGSVVIIGEWLFVLKKICRCTSL
ncbi:uncharacterized protein LOC106012040 [Aplysia californica]|uniref:Uncharacterized protein LOC106012040 n=1 Tax=Aplysia californica TaxID=6500 RepID=A0ABM1A1W3_APLCA|nr:uncharacterized protein LOC106012040 [Aplysia californica]